MTDVRQGATFHTDSVYLGYLVGNGAQSRHRTEGYAFVVHIQPCYDHTYTTVGQLVAHVNQSFVQKLRLINAYYIIVTCQQQNT